MTVTISLPHDKVSVGPYTFDLSKMHAKGIMYLLTFAAKQSLANSTALSDAQKAGLMVKGNKWRAGPWTAQDMEEYEESRRDARHEAIMSGTLEYTVDAPLSGGGRVDDLTKELRIMAADAIKAQHNEKSAKEKKESPMPVGANLTALCVTVAEKYRDLPYGKTPRTWQEEAQRRIDESATVTIEL